jgi:hypothetical protein
MMTLQELSDRREIDDLLIRYCHCIDQLRIDDLDEVFTPDAVIDYTAVGIPLMSYAETKAFLKQALARFAHSQHNISTSRIELSGDRATGRTICVNPMGLPQDDGTVRHMTYYLWYVDELVRTPAGWRISHRREEGSHTENVPESLSPEAG